MAKPTPAAPPQSPPGGAAKLCLECGADNPANYTRCWLCFADLKHAPELILAELDTGESIRPAFAPGDQAQLILGAVVSVLVIIVGIGIGSESPALLIPYGIIVLPSLAAATIRVVRRRAKGESTSVIDSLATFLMTGLISFAVTIVLTVVLIAVAIIYLIALCFQALGG